ncbi:hypothetical protein J3E69DRAFT_356149 [Trichoderma sp. SZMC 28015]
MVFVNVSDGTELMQGTSYANYTNAQYVVGLISRLATSAPLFLAKSYMTDLFDQPVAVYNLTRGCSKSSQSRLFYPPLGGVSRPENERLLEQKIAELPEAEVPRGLVSVRTIDESPSHQAEFVICDLGLTILGGQQDILDAKGSTALSSLKDYLKSRNAIIKIAGWNILCNVCFLPGHQGNCQVKVVCGICQGEHAGQRCPEIANAPAFSSIKLSKVADSVEKLKLQRKQQREDANANAYAQQMRQTTTDYEDYIRARGSAQPVSETIAGPSTKPDHPPREMQLTIQPAAQESVADPQPHFVLPHPPCCYLSK